MGVRGSGADLAAVAVFGGKGCALIAKAALCAVLLLLFGAFWMRPGLYGSTNALTGKRWAWSYANPLKWPDHFAHCGGVEQSPVDLVHMKSVNASQVPLLSLAGYDKSLSSLSLLNNGRTAVLSFAKRGISIKSDLAFRVGRTLVPGPVKYTLEQLHFHWGDGGKDGMGSEHSVDGKHYPGEMHLVHYNSKYASLDEAAAKSDGLLAIGVFLDKAQSGQDLLASAELEKLSFVKLGEGESRELSRSFSVHDLLSPIDAEKYFSYAGSLTTPRCFESVTWIVFGDPLAISPSFLSNLQMMGGANYRPTMRLGSRKVLSP